MCDCIHVFLLESLSISCALQTSKAVDSVASADRRCQFELPTSGVVECVIEGVLACKVAAIDGKVGK